MKIWRCQLFFGRLEWRLCPLDFVVLHWGHRAVAFTTDTTVRPHRSQRVQHFVTRQN